MDTGGEGKGGGQGGGMCTPEGKVGGWGGMCTPHLFSFSIPHKLNVDYISKTLHVDLIYTLSMPQSFISEKF